MRPVTREEIQSTVDLVHAMGPDETRQLMLQMREEQPYLQVYLAAICERGDFDDENDADAFVNLATIVWYAMCHQSGVTIPEISGEQIDLCEDQVMQLYAYAEGEPDSGWPAMVQAWMDGCSQLPLLGFLVDALMAEKNPYEMTEQGGGMIFTYIKTIIDCLDQASAAE